MSPELLILDVDGTLRWTTVPGQKYPLAAAEQRLMPGVKEILRALDFSKTALGIASNQEGVPLGLISRAHAGELIERALVEAIGFLPQRLQIEMCTCPLDQRCACRKPEPGMLLRLLERARVRPGSALYVGDLELDRRAAARAGVPFRWAHEFFQRLE